MTSAGLKRLPRYRCNQQLEGIDRLDRNGCFRHPLTPLYDHIRVTSQNSFFADVSQLCLTYDPINRQHFLQSWRLPNSRVGSVSTSLRRRVTCNGASLSRRNGKRTMSTLRSLTVVCAAVTCTCSPRAGVRRLTVSCAMPPRSATTLTQASLCRWPRDYRQGRTSRLECKAREDW